MKKRIILAVLMLVLGAGAALFIYKTEPRLNSNFENEASFLKSYPFRLGLDLSGGSHLIYQADVSGVPEGEVSNSMEALRDVIERRVNLFGVSEPVVQVQDGGLITGSKNELIVDLPGITDVEKATQMIGQTPLLEFRVERGADNPQEVKVDESGQVVLDLENYFIPTELTGRYLDRATLEFDVNTGEPQVTLHFDDTGTALFAKITKENIGKPVAIYLDGAPISVPTVREEIPNGQAVISGGFTNPNEAKQLVGRLNSGALPVPVTLISKQTIGASLGESAVDAGVKAGLIGFAMVVLFLTLWYRLPGLIAALALCVFALIVLSIFKLIPVTLTAAGLAGFVISMGIAVDANVLIFERIKEEMRKGYSIAESVNLGFSRAWSSIRDSNISNLITALILFWFGTSLIKGFALTLGLGVIVSMFSAITVTRIFLGLVSPKKDGKVARFLFSSGLSK